MALIEFGDESTTVDTWAVAVYELEMQYGGPEEGGWWRTRRDLVAVATADSEDAADRLSVELMGGKYKNTGRALSSVNFGRSGNDKAYSLYIIAPGKSIEHDKSDTAEWS